MTTETPPAEPVTYEGWRHVPPRILATRTQLARCDLPRSPEGPPSAYVNALNYRGKSERTELYALAYSRPTSSSARQLAAAAARRTEPRQCPECGAHCQQPLTEYDSRPLCPMCRHIAQARAFQLRLREQRSALAAWARELLSQRDLAVVWADVQQAPRTASGRARPPLSVHLTAVSHQRNPLLDVRIRLTGPRAAQVPAGALSPADGTECILAGQRAVITTRHAFPLRRHNRQAPKIRNV
ncbi:hypothetical protein J7I98_22125 [Streptomyces sp. ISL-98]|uniref:hypothetical protein n=1 Tax=Streptomyces sp. ISL-98 TaxID=2819192 RepID=UPI001BEA3BB6|nr:hypothetical protein [Streptomyces sp. ISL-98]MBT2508536.1 hypothetical protein [Streptomyces sp. ISL-98]